MGLKNGYTLMIGGPKNQFRHIEPFCMALSAKGGYGYFGNAGAGHFVKSIHNIVEYIYLQGLGEGVELLSKFKQPIDIVKATSVWRPASVINSWLLDLTNTALKRADFKNIANTPMSEGRTPAILEACPRVSGKTLINFSLDSRDMLVSEL